MINLCLSAPPLTPVAQKKSRIYLFLLPPPIGSSKERIVGAIVLTRIEEAMRLAKPNIKPEGSGLVLIDSGLYCYPERVPAAMGVSRIFVSTTYRRLGIAAALLRSGAKTFIHGCPMRFEDGGIAFSQPTESGRGFMEAIGEGYIGIYEE
jgi:N-acetyltransferase